MYPPQRIALAVRAIRERHSVLPLVLCGPGEEPLAKATASAIGGEHISTHEAPPSLGELKALLERSAVLLTSDAGPRHVAEAMGVPVVTWIGPTDPRWSAHSEATVLRNESLSCLGCHLKTCPIGHPCMQDLDPVRVADAASALLEPRS